MAINAASESSVYTDTTDTQSNCSRHTVQTALKSVTNPQITFKVKDCMHCNVRCFFFGLICSDSPATQWYNKYIRMPKCHHGTDKRQTANIDCNRHRSIFILMYSSSRPLLVLRLFLLFCCLFQRCGWEWTVVLGVCGKTHSQTHNTSYRHKLRVVYVNSVWRHVRQCLVRLWPSGRCLLGVLCAYWWWSCAPCAEQTNAVRGTGTVRQLYGQISVGHRFSAIVTLTAAVLCKRANIHGGRRHCTRVVNKL